jgi:hypothetical protein
MVNSLRLSGNRGNVVVVDGGLTPPQREQLAEVATVVEPPKPVEGGHPLSMKPSIYLLKPEGVVVLVDSDMIVTRPIDDLVARAQEGKIVVFPDHVSKYERWFPEWEELFELDAAPERRLYVNAGFVALSVERWPRFLERWYRATRRIPPEQIQRDPRDPAWAADQDALNAILMSEVAREDVWVGPEWESIHPDGLRRVRIVDEDRLTCTYRGSQTTVLHFSLYPKPWQRRAWWRITHEDAYVALMPRVLFGRDVPLRPAEDELPFWARPGSTARAAWRTLGVAVGAAYRAKRIALAAREKARSLSRSS